LKGVYYDEENRRHLNTIREAYGDLAMDLIYRNRKDEARKVLNKCDKMMLEENFAYGQVSRNSQHNRNSQRFLAACYAAEDKELAEKVYKSLRKDLNQQQDYYASLNSKMSRAEYDKLMTEYLLRYRTARTRQDQMAADQMIENSFNSDQMKMLDDIRMSYNMFMEVDEMKKTNEAPKAATVEPAIRDTPVKN